MPDSPIRWEEPPPATSRSTTWAERLTPLLDHPGRWAIIATYKHMSSAASAASQLRHIIPGGNSTLIAAHFEFVGRESKGGEAALFARYTGPDQEGQERPEGERS